MITLALINVLRTILYIVIFYYVVKFLARVLLPYILKRKLENIQKQQGFSQDNQAKKRPEGEVRIENKNNSNKDKSGFSDYEEIE